MVVDVVSSLHVAALAAGALLLVGAGLHDVVARTVPDGVCALIAAIGFSLRILEGNGPVALLLSVGVAAAVFIFAALCWQLRWMGGGDVKLLAAVAFLVPPGSVPILVIDVALAGGVLAITYLILYAMLPARAGSSRRPQSVMRRAMRIERWRISRMGPIPYASAIAAGALFCLLG